MQGHVQVGVFVNGLEVLWAVFDRDSRFVDATTSAETEELLVPLMRFWSAFARSWSGGPDSLQTSQTIRGPRRHVLAVGLWDGPIPETPALAPDLVMTNRLIGYEALAGRSTALIASDIANIVTTAITVGSGADQITVDEITNQSRYHVDTGRGFLVASYSVTRVTGARGPHRFTHQEIDVLRWKP